MKKKIASSRKKISPFDFSSWNFIIFLVLALVLIVFVALVLRDRAYELGISARNSCPDITSLPRPEACPGGEWKFKRDENGCRVFECRPGLQPTPTWGIIPLPTEILYR